jgi:hypothetical protein
LNAKIGEAKMSQVHKFRAIIEDAGSGGAYVTIPFDVEIAFGKKRVKVAAAIEGLPYRGSLVRMGTACHILGIRKDIREKLGKTVGQEIEIAIKEDIEARVVAVPPDLSEALKNVPEAEMFFQQLSYSHQKEYVQWIEEAKRDLTRQSRIEKTLQLLKEGKKER